MIDVIVDRGASRDGEGLDGKTQFM